MLGPDRASTTPPGASPREAALLAGVLAVAAGLRLAFSESISGNDDLSVANCALDALDAGWPPRVPTAHYCARFGLVGPMALVFGLAGTGAAQASVLPALASLAGLLLAWGLGRRLFGPAEGLAAAAALALFPMDIEFAGLAFPDAPQGALMAGAVLCLLRAADPARPARGRAALGLAALAGALWAWAYYVKVDAGLLVLVLGLAWALGLARFAHVAVAGAVALALVAAEWAAYAAALGEPLLRLRFESAAANEVLAPGRDYRNALTYPKAMFALPYQAGVMYWAWAAALAAAALARSRPALFLAGWTGLWMLWLALGADPTSGFRLKPQIPRYLMSFAVPTAVLSGWLAVRLWRSTRRRALARPAAVALAAGAAASAAVFAPFNLLSYEGARATRVAAEAAARRGWVPLCPDVQSRSIVRFLSHGRPGAAGEPCVVQRHDFLRGETTFAPPAALPAYLLLNESFARRLQDRSLVRPVDPRGFPGAAPTEVLRVDNPMPSASYAALRLLAAAASAVPLRSVRDGIAATAAEVLRDADARVWRLDPVPPPAGVARREAAEAAVGSGG